MCDEFKHLLSLSVNLSETSPQTWLQGYGPQASPKHPIRSERFTESESRCLNSSHIHHHFSFFRQAPQLPPRSRSLHCNNFSGESFLPSRLEHLPSLMIAMDSPSDWAACSAECRQNTILFATFYIA